MSDMEMEIALRIGVRPSNIIWNGPFKNAKIPPVPGVKLL